MRGNSISSKQVKAARALLDWSQEELAQRSRLSVATIRKLEAGNISPRGKTNDSLRQAFENAGLDFLDSNGLREKPEDITVYHGKEGTAAFFDDVYQTVKGPGGEIVVVCISEEPFAEALDDYLEFHVSRMLSLKHKVSVKCIITENYIYTPASSYCEYRSISKAYVDSVPFYVYGDNYAIFLFDADPMPKIIVHHSALLAKAYRRQFHSMWDKAAVLDGPEKKG